MSKSEMTLMLEEHLFKMCEKSKNLFGINEVSYIKDGSLEICDFVTLQRGGFNACIRCYEIKISKSDFLSKNANSFWGDYNYYCMPDELYEELKEMIPKEIGVIGRYGVVLKRATGLDLYEDERAKIVLAVFYRLFSVTRGNSPSVLEHVKLMFGGKNE